MAVRENGSIPFRRRSVPQMSSKRRVGVLEAHEAPESSTPQTFCGREIAELMIEAGAACRIGKRLVRMLAAKAAEVIAALKLWREQRREAEWRREEDIRRDEHRITSVSWRPHASGPFTVMQARVCHA
jgi:hypothetical protein